LNDTVFLHAGINPEQAPRRLDDVNQQVLGEIRRWDEIQRRMIDRRLVLPFFTLTEVLMAAQIETQIAEPTVDQLGLKGLLSIENWALIDSDGPMWFRGFATWTPDSGAPRIQELLRRYKVARFVVGHTVQERGRITPRFSGAVYLIDTGMLSSFFRGGRASALEIQDGQFTAIYADSRDPLTVP
jgi:hypothetical protein